MFAHEGKVYSMKKLLALVLALLMLLSSAAFAEETAAVVSEEIVFEEMFPGTWIQFDQGFEMYLPSDWLVLEATEEEQAMGIAFSIASPDGAYLMTMAWSALEVEASILDVQEVMAARYPVELIEVNGIGMLVVGDPDNDTISIIAMDGAEPGYYSLVFAPMSNEELRAYATVIVASLRNIEPAA